MVFREEEFHYRKIDRINTNYKYIHKLQNSEND